MNLTILPLYGQTNAKGLVFAEEDEDKLRLSTSAIGSSKVFGKSTYALWIRYFN